MSEFQFKTIRGQTFSNQTVKVDGKRFIDCAFDGCIIQFGATAPFQIEGKSSIGNVQWSFVENAAATVHVMKLLWNMNQHDTIHQIFQHVTGTGLADLPNISTGN